MVHAQIVGNQVIDILEASGVDAEVTFVRSPLPGVMHGPRGGKLQFLSGNRTAGHGLDIDLGIVDETGLLPNSNESLQNVFDAVAARDGRVILTGTQGDNLHYREIIERPDARTAVHIYAADLDDDVSDPAVWKKANPGLGTIKSAAFMRDAYEKGDKSGSLTEFRVWQTNQPLSSSRQLLIEYGQLQRAYDATAKPIPGEPCFVGLDLGGSAAMTAAVIVYKESGLIRSLAAFPGEGELDLAKRGKRDGVGNLYVKLAETGELFETSGAVTDVAEFLSRLRDEIGDHPVQSISGDRYRDAEFRTAMGRAKIDWPLITRGTGPKDGDNDIRATRRVFLSGRANLQRSLLIEAAVAEADVKVSAKGACQLDKSHRNARIDVALAEIEKAVSNATAYTGKGLLPMPSTIPEEQQQKAAVGLQSSSLAVVSSKADFAHQTGGHGSEFRRVDLTPDLSKADLNTFTTDLHYRLLAGCGIPPALVTANGNAGAMREGYRLFALQTILPLVRQCKPELSRKIGADKLSIDAMMSADVAGRARAVGVLTGAGVALDKAMKLVGWSDG